LAPAEAKAVTRLGLEAADPDTTVMVGVGHDVASAREAARDAQAAGAAMIMVHQPVHPYVSVDGWIEYHRAIASDVPELGVVLYVRNETIPGSAFARLGESCPNVIGVKYAVPNPARFAAVAADAGAGRFTWVAGLAELHAPGYFAVGATGFTSGLANVDPSTSLRLFHALDDRDHDVVTEIWHRVRPFEELRAANASANNVSVVKEALCQLGICARDIRPPSSLLSTELRVKVTEILELWGLLP
jgi:4-hydroxy-tetrahydrodipicolinate synthase